MTSPERLYHLALRELHTTAGATFVVRDGWSLPGSYGDPRAEHAALRGSAAVFDRSERSRLLVTGTDAMDVLAAVFAGHVNELEEGRAMRTVRLDEAGAIRDVVLIARTGGIAYMVSGEPGQRYETFEQLRGAVQADFDAKVDDRTESTCLIGLAGPAAGDAARTQLSAALPARLQTLQSLTFEFHGFRTMVTRTSDTGEDGFEFMVAPAVAQHMIDTLRGAGIALAGHVALECARVEACVPAFEPDLAPGLSPAEADLDVLLGIPGGREERILSALIVDGDGVPGVGAAITMEGRGVGEMRSCLRSFALNATIGLGIIDTREALPGRTFSVAGAAASIVAKPFLRRRQTG